MCLSFFEGKGYSDTFTRHMGQVQKMLEANPGITVAAQSDMICEKCPNLKEGQCLSAGKVRSYDKEVLARCNLPTGGGEHSFKGKKKRNLQGLSVGRNLFQKRESRKKVDTISKM